MNEPLVLDAISFAALKHAGQLRKDGVTPYVAHPLRVLTIMATVFDVEDPQALAAAALHDTIEDTATDWDELAERFGEVVAGYVARLSKDKRLPEEEREQAYLETLANSPLEVKLCKLADAYDNLVDARTLSAKARRKAIDKAQTLVDRFSPLFPNQWQHAIDRLRQQIEHAEESPGS